MVAAMARYHRRGLPKKRHESWQLIEGREERRTVSEMALLLRLAAALDRRPQALIGSLKVKAVGPKAAATGVRILLRPQPAEAGQPEPDLSLECWSLRSCADAVATASGLALLVEGPEGLPPT
jgi:exopolyphosphatase/guanosine-5'-triphosphate,3'-diphosphate pyrophosphatase